MDDFDLLTVAQAGEHLYMSEQAVRRLVKSGKLAALKEGGRLLIRPESVQAYAEAQPHPLRHMAALRHAQTQLGVIEGMERHGALGAWGTQGTGSPYASHLGRLKPLLAELKMAVKAGDYALADDIGHRIWQEESDYEMLHRPIKTGEVRQAPERPAWIMDRLLPDA